MLIYFWSLGSDIDGLVLWMCLVFDWVGWIVIDRLGGRVEDVVDVEGNPSWK